MRVVFTDIDGTLVGKGGNLFADGEGCPTTDAALAIAALAEAGIELVLLSGRRAAQVAPIAGFIGAAGYLAEMGTISWDDRDRELTRILGDYPFGDQPPFEAMKPAIELLLERNPGCLEFHAPWHDERETSHLLRGMVDLEAENRALERAGLGWCLLVDNGVIPHEFVGLEVEKVRAYHMVPKGAGKAAGVRAWLREREISPADAVAIGDARADLEIAAEVGAFFMMRNGVDHDPELAREVSRYSNVSITERGFGSGWAEVVRSRILGGR